MLNSEIERAQQKVKTDAYQMSIGEIVSMYENDELIINPEFQRLFRWDVGQKSRLIESILLGIPLPSIFVFETEEGKWELIDGLQRISTILEFMGKLRDSNGTLVQHSILAATKYLPSLYNTVWDNSDLSPEIARLNVAFLEKSQQLAIKRSRIGVQILKRPSDENSKYELFQRLNAGGTPANAQELRNCIIIMVNRGYYQAIKLAAEKAPFTDVFSFSDDQMEKQRHMEMAVRFLVHTRVAYDGAQDVEPYIDRGIIELAQQGNGQADSALIDETFDLLVDSAGRDCLRRFDGKNHVGRVGLVGFEVIAVGVAKNIDGIRALGEHNAKNFVKNQIHDFWNQPEVDSFMSPGLRGTMRIQRTVPFGAKWFLP